MENPSEDEQLAMDDDLVHEPALQARVRERLNILGLNPYSAARRVGAPQDTIRNILRASGEYSPRPRTLRLVAEALETSEDWLLKGVEVQDTIDTGIDQKLHRKATVGAVRALEVSGLTLEPGALSDMILRIYELKKIEQEKLRLASGE